MCVCFLKYGYMIPNLLTKASNPKRFRTTKAGDAVFLDVLWIIFHIPWVYELRPGCNGNKWRFVGWEFFSILKSGRSSWGWSASILGPGGSSNNIPRLKKYFRMIPTKEKLVWNHLFATIFWVGKKTPFQWNEKTKKTKTARVREEKTCMPSLLIHFLFVKATHKSRAVSSKDRTMIIRSKRFLSRTEQKRLDTTRQQVTHGARAVVVERLCVVVLWFIKWLFSGKITISCWPMSSRELEEMKPPDHNHV